MTSPQALLNCAPSDVTIDRVRRLVAAVGPEVPTVEYKENMSQTIAKGVAALANTYGGLLLVGVSNDRKLKGVKETTIEAVAEHCHANLEPPWIPEILPVAMDDTSGRYILVLRIVPGEPPRPLLVGGAAPIRYHSTIKPADWHHLARMFNEPDTVQEISPWDIQAPNLPRDPTSSQEDLEVDFMVRSGMSFAIDSRAQWRPLREADGNALIGALDRAPLTAELTELVAPGRSCSISKFQRQGHATAPVNHPMFRDGRHQARGSWPAGPGHPVRAKAALRVLRRAHVVFAESPLTRRHLSYRAGRPLPGQRSRFRRLSEVGS